MENPTIPLTSLKSSWNFNGKRHINKERQKTLLTSDAIINCDTEEIKLDDQELVLYSTENLNRQIVHSGVEYVYVVLYISLLY